MLNIKEVKKVLTNVDIDKYKKFCVLNKVKGIGYADMSVIKEFKKIKYPLLENALFLYTMENDIILVMNPYISDKECKELLNKYSVNGIVYGKQESFCIPGETNMVSVKVGKY